MIFNPFKRKKKTQLSVYSKHEQGETSALIWAVVSFGENPNVGIF